MKTKTRWIVQANLGSSDEIDRLYQACGRLGIAYCPVEVIPFSNELPDVSTELPSLFYGSARFILNALRAEKWRPCAFWNDDYFRYSMYKRYYGHLLLNGDGCLATLGELSRMDDVAEDEIFFIRPNRDLKEFNGQLMSLKEVRDWTAKLAKLNGEGMVGPETPVFASSPKTVRLEWRLFMVEGQFVAGSQYRKYGALEICGGVPSAVRDFAESAAKMWAPADAFVMDVCESGKELKIIELNGLNSTGFYDSNIEDVVRSVTELAEKTTGCTG